jgi:hypothetical protein
MKQMNTLDKVTQCIYYAVSTFLQGVRVMNKKLGLKLVPVLPVLMVALLASSAHAGVKTKKLDPASAMALLRSEFTNAGITLNIDTPYLMGKTSDGEVCSIDVKLLAPLRGYTDTADMNLYVGDRTAADNSQVQASESVFMIFPEDPTFEIRQLTTSDNELSLASVFVQPQDFKTFLGLPYIPTKTIHRSIQIMTDANKKIVSIHIADESTDQTCNLD